MRRQGLLVGLLVVVAALAVAGGAWAMDCCNGGNSATCCSSNGAKSACCAASASAAITASSVAASAQPTTAAKVVNTKCPIEGGTVDPNKVPDSLTRDFKGQKVGFCCAGCPDQWDKLSDADKESKLKAVLGAK